MQRATERAAFIAGFVAGEGTFTRSGSSFTFAVRLGAIDADVCAWMREFFGVGTIHASPRRKPHYDDEVVFQVRKAQNLVEVVIPFMDEHLPASYKREQYLDWRAQVLDYWDVGMKRRRECRVDGCERPARGKGLCRHHYYVEEGK